MFGNYSVFFQPGEKQLAATTTGMDNRNAARFLPIMIVLISVVLLLIILSMIIILVLRSQMCRSSTTSLASATIEKEIVPSMDGSIHSTGTMNELLNTTLPTPDNSKCKYFFRVKVYYYLCCQSYHYHIRAIYWKLANLGCNHGVFSLKFNVILS